MADKSNIEWTDATWNPVVGCSVVSPGCTNCYAMKMAARIEHMAEATLPQGAVSHYAGTTKPSNGGAVWTGKVAPAPDNLFLKPLSWKRPRRIFVNSMGDLFHESIPDEWIDSAFAVMALTPQHTYQVLTKRAARMRAYMLDGASNRAGVVLGRAWSELGRPSLSKYNHGNITQRPWPLPNVWLGVSTERQQEAEERIPLLLKTPAAVRFISAEPLLGPIDLIGTLARFQDDPIAKRQCAVGLGRQLIDWVIVGGESGPGARPMHPEWARALRDQCAAAGVSFFFKQWGEFTPGENVERQRGIVETATWFNDRWSIGSENLARDDGHVDDQPDLYRVGKKSAGRYLDGVKHSEFPQAREIAFA